MIRLRFIPYLILFIFSLVTENAIAQCGDTIDFNTWIPTANPANGNWVPSNIVNGKALTVTQNINGEPTFFVSPDTFINVEITGKIEVNTTADDDWVGFVFGYKGPPDTSNTDTCQFFLFDWKQAGQTNFYNASQPPAKEGFSLCEVNGVFDWNSNISFSPYFFSHKDNPAAGFTRLDSLYGAGLGWADQTQYEFTLIYTVTTIKIIIEGDTIFERNGCYEPGRFGFYNFSQDNVIYSDFNYKLNGEFAIIGDRVCFGGTTDLISVFDTCFNQEATFAQIASWDWDLGDGTTSTDTNVSHTYSSPGFYNVSLIVTDNSGACKDTSYKTVEVYSLPDVNLGNDTLTCLRDTLILDAGPGFSYNWNTGDTTRFLGVNSVDSFFVTITDAQSCIDIDTLVVTGLYTIPPTPVCQNATVYIDSSGNVTIDTTTLNNGSTAFCQIDTMWVNPTSFTCNELGVNAAKLFVQDANGNLDSCAANVTVVDTIPPTIVAKNDTVYLDASGSVSFNIINFNRGSFDNCSLIGLTTDITNLTCADTGLNNVIITATDQSSNSSFDTVQVLVLDTTPPTTLCNDSINLYLDASGSILINFALIDTGSFDNCGILSYTLSDSIFSCSNVGIDTTTLTITDLSGNQNSCIASVFVIDTIPPTAICKDTIVYLDSLGQISILDTGSFVTIFYEDFTLDFNGTYTAPQTITNWNITSGSIDLSPFIGGIPGNEIDLSGNDKGTIETINSFSLLPGVYTFSFDHINNTGGGFTNDDTVRINIGNLFSGDFISNTTLKNESASFTVTSTSNATIEISQLGDNNASGSFVGNISLTGKLNASIGIDNGSFDACGVATIASSDTIFDCTQIDTNVVTLTVTDANGNISICQSNVIVLDTLPPVLQTKNDTLWLDAAGTVSFDFTNFNQGFSDNCGVDSLWTNITSLACADTGWNNISYFGRDVNGNTDSVLVQLLIIDSIAPSLICPADTTLSNDSSFCLVVDSLPQPLFGDSCGILSIVNSFNGSAFLNDTFSVDTHLISWTVTDVNGNVSSCSFSLTVLDTELPTISCPNDTAIGFCHDTLFYALPVFNDNCPGFALALDSGLGSGVHFPIGTNTEYYTVTDAYGNSASCSFNVFVDTIPYLQLGPDTAICDYDEVILTAGIPFNAGLDSNFTYLWQDSSTTVEFIANYADTFYVTKTDSFGCTAVDSISLSILVSPSLPFVSDTGICFGDTAILRAGPDSSVYSYLWADTSGIISNNISIATADSGFYGILKIDTSTTCFAADTIFVTVNPLPTPFIGNDTSICEGLVITFDAYNSYERYTWQDSTQAFSYTTDSAGVYAVTVSDFNGCVGVDSVELSIFPNPVVTFTVMHDSVTIVNTDDSSRVCDGVNISIQVTDSFNIFFWSTGSPNQSINVTTSGSYNVLVFDSNNCNSNATYKVVVDTLPFVNLGNDTTICNLDSIVIDAGPNLLSYAWNTGDTSQTLQIFSADTFSVVVTDSNSCIGIDTFILSIDTLPRVSLGPDTTICLRDEILVSPGAQFASYQWSFFAPDTHTVAISTVGDYWVQVTDANNCSATSDTISLFNDTLPNVQLGPDQSICIGDSVNLDAGPGYISYNWSNGPTLQTQTVNSTGSFVVTVVDANQCIGSDTFNLVVNNLPTVNLGSNKRYCDGVSFNLQLTANQGPPYQSYLWSTAQTGQGITVCDQPGACNNVILNFPDTIWVTATDINGCVNTDTIVIARGANPVVNIAMSDTSYCSDEVKSIVLDAGPGFNSYAWTKQNAPNFNESGQIILVDTAGTYFISVTDVNGCSGGDVVIIREYQAPNVNLPKDTAFCENVAFNLNLNAGAGIGNVYDWSTGETTQTIQASSPGTYAVTVTTPQFCDSEDKITIAQVPLPQANLENDTLVCSGSFLELDVFNDGYTYLWNTGSLDSAILVDTAGIYTVRLRNKYCTVRDTAFVQFDYVPFIDLGPDSILCQGELNILDAFFPNSKVAYLWQDGSEDTTFTASFAGNYSVLVTNRCGSFLDNIELFYEDCSNIYAPNSFSPNGDGDNDFYRLYSDQNFTFFELQIFNRGGEPVFQSSSLNVQWDGTFNGIECPIGAYTYYLRYASDLDPNGGIYTQVGTVVLIR